MSERDDALRVIRRQADALHRRGFDDAPHVDRAADTLERLTAGLRERFLVVGAPGWPGGIEPHPNTLENAQRFVARHGGTLRRRLESEWEDVTP